MNARLLRGRSTPAIRAIVLLFPLSLLVFRILANHPHHTFAVDDLALIANLLYRCPYFHKSVLGRSSLVVGQSTSELSSAAAVPTRLFIAIHNPPAIQIVRRKLNCNFISWQNANEILAHLAGNMRQN